MTDLVVEHAQPITATAANAHLTSMSPPPPSSRHQSVQLYSPTQAEIDNHPIIAKRYSPQRDQPEANLGSAPSPPPVETTTTSSTMADKQIEKGDEVSWPWSGGRPGGTVDEVKDEGELTVTSKKGKEIKKNADPENPAVKVVRSGNDVVKRASELDVEEKGDGNEEDAGDDKKEEETAEANGDAQTGDKRKADDDDAEKEDAEDKPADAKKSKTDAKENGEKAAPKKKGRPAKKDANGSSKSKAEPKKKREPKKAATESGQPRRSGRNSAK
ncbi:hypothetical protein LTR56_023481 [Elasticomyces elasticus]|nr:hypothetical protein LTR56_023481 [Elasticomyces elasticus]KAK3625522.1 hypothetical protein LTR22_023536 [Elasticomyces elasticus]KAK4920683.1 hypothetical protein LTR49_011759 [Elasticomyces elasticus]KAK5746333.1 hypothetical protein LTS12_022766 [Elasticomyces elasticus]